MGDVDAVGPELDPEGEGAELALVVQVDEPDELQLGLPELSLPEEALAVVGDLALGHGRVGHGRLVVGVGVHVLPEENLLFFQAAMVALSLHLHGFLVHGLLYLGLALVRDLVLRRRELALGLGVLGRRRSNLLINELVGLLPNQVVELGHSFPLAGADGLIWNAAEGPVVLGHVGQELLQQLDVGQLLALPVLRQQGQELGDVGPHDLE